MKYLKKIFKYLESPFPDITKEERNFLITSYYCREQVLALGRKCAKLQEEILKATMFRIKRYRAAKKVFAAHYPTRDEVEKMQQRIEKK